MVKGLVCLLLAAALAVVFFFWPWSYQETILPVIDISGYILKSWAPMLLTLFVVSALYLIARRTFLR